MIDISHVARAIDSNFDSFIFKRSVLMVEGKPLNIMMIDDSRKDIDLFHELLSIETNLNFTLTSWTKPTEALQALENNLVRPDIIVLDLLMPSMHGKMVLKRLKCLCATQSIPVVIYSSMNNYENALNVGQMEAHAFFAKPVDPCAFKNFVEGNVDD